MRHGTIDIMGHQQKIQAGQLWEDEHGRRYWIHTSNTGSLLGTESDGKRYLISLLDTNKWKLLWSDESLSKPKKHEGCVIEIDLTEEQQDKLKPFAKAAEMFNERYIIIAQTYLPNDLQHPNKIRCMYIPDRMGQLDKVAKTIRDVDAVRLNNISKMKYMNDIKE